jgi:hypothetical protein
MKTPLILAALSFRLCMGQTADTCAPSALNIPEAKFGPLTRPEPRSTPAHWTEYRPIATEKSESRVAIGMQNNDRARGDLYA